MGIIVITMGIPICIQGDMIHLNTHMQMGIPIFIWGSVYAYRDPHVHMGMPHLQLSNGDGDCEGNVEAPRTGPNRTFVAY
jgi:hypothetical protein